MTKTVILGGITIEVTVKNIRNEGNLGGTKLTYLIQLAQALFRVSIGLKKIFTV